MTSSAMGSRRRTGDQPAPIARTKRLARDAAALAILLALAQLPGAAGLAQSQQGVVGTYCLTGVREVGSCFRFSAEQRFEYYLSYGAYDESSEGLWRLEGSEIVLESAPYDRRPGFAFKERHTAAGDRFKVVVTHAGRGLAGVDVRVSCGTSVHEGYTQQTGYDTPCATPPDQVALGIRMMGVPLDVIAISGSGSEKALIFEFEPGDIGKKAFTGTRLRQDGTGLRMIYRSSAVGDLDGKSFTYRRN